MKKILVLGSGGREHVIAETLARSRQSVQLIGYGSNNNPGLLNLCEHYEIGNLNNFSHIQKTVREHNVDWAIIGPETPLANGIRDFLNQLDVLVVGPTKKAAQLESSKGFARNLLNKYGIPGNPRFQIFRSEAGIKEFLTELGENYVIKADGLMGGKGVKVAGDHLNNHEEAINYSLFCIKNCGQVIIEEKLIGQEFSLMSLTDGQTLSDFPPVQDHKRAYEFDQGPNTGGMGSYSDSNHLLPFLSQQDLQKAHEINRAVIEALKQEISEPYQGILYGGFMLTKNDVHLIEYNVRFGDPEAMNILPILESDFADCCEAIFSNSLKEIPLKFASKATVCKYLVPEGYPDHPLKNVPIEINNFPSNVRLYYASVDQKKNGLYLCGSRALGIVGIADNLESAQSQVESAIGNIKGPLFHRRDIGTKALIQQKIAQME